MRRSGRLPIQRILAYALTCGTVLIGHVETSCGASGGWAYERVAGPFLCRSDFPPAEIAPLLGELGRLQSELAQVLEIPAAEETIELYLFRAKADYDRFLARNYPKVTYRRALYVRERGLGRVFAYRGPQFEVDLRHECTHALLHAALPMVPLWLDEGLAVYFEVAPQSRAKAPPQLSGLIWSLRISGAPKLENLEKKADIQSMEQADYRAAWAWVHFMLHSSTESREVLLQYLSDIQRGNPPGVLSRRLRERLRDPAGQFTAHFKTWTWAPAGGSSTSRSAATDAGRTY